MINFRQLVRGVVAVFAIWLSCDASLVSLYPFDGDTNDSVGPYDLNHVAGGDREPPSYATVHLAGGSVTHAAVFNKLQYLRSDNPLQFHDEPTTLAFWVKAEELDNQCPIGVQSNDHRLEFRLMADGRVAVLIWSGETGWVTPIEVDGGYSEGDWVHITLTYDPDPKEMALYLDGDEAGVATLDSAVALSGQLMVGRRALTPIWAFSGQLADLRVLRRVVTTTEARALMNREMKMVQYTFDGNLENQAIPGWMDLSVQAGSAGYTGAGVPAGAEGKAVVLDGMIALYGDATDDESGKSDFPVPRQVTIGFWIKPEIMDHSRPFSLGIDRHHAWELNLQERSDGGHLFAWLNAEREPMGGVFGPVPADTWTHLALTHDLETGEMTVYINGNPAGGDTGGEVGGDGGISPYWFTGGMADIQVYNHVLDPEAVAALAGTEGEPAKRSVSHYLFDQDTTDSIGSYDLNHVAGAGREPPAYATVDLADGTVTNAAVFNGLQYLRADDNNQFADGPATIAFWVKADSLAAQCPVGIQSNDHRLEFRMMADGNISVMTRVGADPWATPIEVAAGYSAGDWVHVALTYDPEGAMTLYLDGVGAGSAVPDAAVALSGQLMVGRRQLTPIWAFSGQLADLRVYDDVLGAYDIASLAGVDEPVSPPDIEGSVIALDGSAVVVSLSFTPLLGRSYGLQFRTNLAHGSWTDVVSGATESPLVYTNEHPAGFFRIKAEK